jgi:probable rRNA maturation factor
MAALNRGYKGRRGAAEVLTFDYGDDPSPGVEGSSGEILICWKRLAASAAGLKVSGRSYLLRLVAHGLAHLEGFSHGDEMDAARMEGRERELLGGIVPERDLAKMFG